mmetsp:Transcript_63074/g.117336  ORF Transcript_63074/g.117336 Transcript_63074/m.117336 type:complete len:333 (-) Transcript_63074:103-1101(-)
MEIEWEGSPTPTTLISWRKAALLLSDCMDDTVLNKVVRWAEHHWEHANIALAVLAAGSSLTCFVWLARSGIGGHAEQVDIRPVIGSTEEVQSVDNLAPTIPQAECQSDPALPRSCAPSSSSASTPAVHFGFSTPLGPSDSLRQAAVEFDRVTAAIVAACHAQKAIRLLRPITPVLPGGYPVKLNIYDVSQQANIQKLNSFLANRLSPLKFGGVFHAGVEVDGAEWSFGFCVDGTGVSRSEPRQHAAHHYRETILLPCTRLSRDEIESVVKDLEERYQGYTYDLLQRNCCHFADEFCQRLHVGPIPSWIHRLARVASGMKRFTQAFNVRVHQL